VRQRKSELLTGSALHRCAWAESDPLLREYHDTEWGIPEFDSRTLWEQLILESFQAGLAWITVLHKREAFRTAFRQFDPAQIARFGEPDIASLLADPGIIRSRTKIEATIGGARAFLACGTKASTSPSGFGNWPVASLFRTVGLFRPVRHWPKSSQKS